MIDSRRLDLSFLEQASSLAEYESEPQKRAYRDSVVMHFLFAYELAIQAIRRYLELESLKSAEGSTLGFQNLIRRADAHGIVQTGWPGFSRFRDARNAVAHTYDEKRALEVTRIAKEFSGEVQFLLNQLKGRAADGE